MTEQNQLATFQLVRWNDLPTMPLYIDQLLQLVNQMMVPLDLPLVTKTMVNSYVKQHLFSRPAGRRYTRNHVVAVLVVSILKTDFALSKIGPTILAIRDTRQVKLRYQQFSHAFEGTLRETALEQPADSMERKIQLAARTVGTHLLTLQTLG